MKVDLTTTSEPKHNETKEYLDKQQAIDTLLVLSKLAELQLPRDVMAKVETKMLDYLNKL